MPRYDVEPLAEWVPMRKVIALALLVIAVWTAGEVYLHGVGGAFGGLFFDGVEGSTAVDDAPADQTTSHRTMDAFQRAYDKSESRVDKLMDQPGHSE